jgi:hypothetical protein
LRNGFGFLPYGRAFNIYATVLTAVLFIAASVNVYNNVRLYNSYIEGSVIETAVVDNVSAYRSYRILSGNDTLSAEYAGFRVKAGDKVKCIKKNGHSVRILEVNGSKVQEKYGFRDWASLITVIVCLPFFIRRYGKKNALTKGYESFPH